MESVQVVKVRREKITACMTCPLCNKLLKDATTISICLHTFCRKCIYEKLSDEDFDSCPVCNINLGCIPQDKLRPDNNLQDIRAKIFPFRRRKVEALDIAPTVLPPAKRKERSLSSLVVSSPRVSLQSGVTGRRMRVVFKKDSATRGTSPANEETPKKDDDLVERCMADSSSPETLNKIVQNKKQGSSAKSSNDRGEHTENKTEGREGKLDLWKPLNTLVEAVNRSKFSKSGSPRTSHVQTDPASYKEVDACTNKVKSDDLHRGKSSVPSSPGQTKRKRIRQVNKNILSKSKESPSSKLILNVARHNWRDGPIWFSLVASGDQDGVEPLPQVSNAFLRVKDTNIPISSIQKYLMTKLNLTSQEEVQVMCHGQPVMLHLKLRSLLDLWLRTLSTPKKVQAFVGDSAKDFVMVLSYSRKVAVPRGVNEPI
ncbi:hypothetical protein RND81_04G025600 [Saponaria officinalis]|uniref:RING-type domain-containing protein n=1 Tax=Saponaria officinalis TaxID=3572 RepID=A0AAW1LGX2_SAPOF